MSGNLRITFVEDEAITMEVNYPGLEFAQAMELIAAMYIYKNALPNNQGQQEAVNNDSTIGPAFRQWVENNGNSDKGV